MEDFKEIEQQMKEQEKNKKEEEVYLKRIEHQQMRDEKKKLKKQTKIYKKQNRLEALKHLIDCAPGSSWESSIFEKEGKMFEKLGHPPFRESQMVEKGIHLHCSEEAISNEEKEVVKSDAKMEKKKECHKKFTNLSLVQEITHFESNFNITDKIDNESEESESEDQTISFPEERVKCDQSLLSKHLTMYEDLIRIQPKRHTEKQLLMEAKQKKETYMNAEKIELARLRAEKKREFEEMKKTCKKGSASLTLNKALMDCPLESSTNIDRADGDRKSHGNKEEKAEKLSSFKEIYPLTRTTEKNQTSKSLGLETSESTSTSVKNQTNQEEIKAYRPPPPPENTTDLVTSRIVHLAV